MSTFLTSTFQFEPEPHSVSRSKDTFINQLKRIITSATLLVIAYILTFLVHQYTMGLLCIAFGYDPDINYNYIGNLPYHYKYWNVKRITIIFASPALVCLFLGIFALDFFNSLSGVGSLARFFVLWCTVCCLNIFLSFLLISPIAVENYSSNLYTGFSIVGAWWRLGKVLMIPLSFVSLTGSILLGYLTSSMFIKFSFSKTLIDTEKGRRKMLFQLYILPILFAAPVLIFLSSEQSFLIHVFHLANLLIMTIGMFMGIENLSRDIRVYGHDVLNTIPVFWMAVAAGLVALVIIVWK